MLKNFFARVNFRLKTKKVSRQKFIFQIVSKNNRKDQIPKVENTKFSTLISLYKYFSVVILV